MEWLGHCIGRQSETEIIDLQDSFSVNSEVDKILTRSQARKQSRVEHKARAKLIKKWKLKKVRWVNIEHLIPKCKWWINAVVNFKTSDINEHRGKHMYLWVKLFHEQLIQIMDDNFQVMHDKTRDLVCGAILAILQNHLKAGELYKEECFKSKNFIPRSL